MNRMIESPEARKVVNTTMVVCKELQSLAREGHRTEVLRELTNVTNYLRVQVATERQQPIDEIMQDQVRSVRRGIRTLKGVVMDIVTNQDGSANGSVLVTTVDLLTSGMMERANIYRQGIHSTVR